MKARWHLRLRIFQLKNCGHNTAIVAGAAKIFNVPTVVTTVAEKSFSGPVFPEVSEFYPANTYIDRTTMNTWEDVNAYKAITGKNKKKIVLAGLVDKCMYCWSRTYLQKLKDMMCM